MSDFFCVENVLDAGETSYPLPTSLGATPQEEPFSNGFERFFLKNGQRQGMCRGYYEDGRLSSESYYQDGKLHGPVKYWSKEGVLLTKSHYIQGKKSGCFQLWYPSGKLYSQQYFVRSAREGIHLYYYESGALRTKMGYQENNLHGRMEQFYEDGKPKRIVEYERGLRCGIDTIWLASGHLSMQAHYRNSEPVDTLCLYHDNGEMAERYQYIGPSWHFHVQRFDREGNLWQEGYSESPEFYEEKTYEKGRLTCHERLKRSSSGQTLETIKLL